MSEEDDEQETNVERRHFLGGVTSVVVGVGIAASCVPFISSMNPTADIVSAATTEVDLKPIAPGETKTVLWQKKPVFVMHRTDEEIRRMQASTGGFDTAADKDRVQKPQWLVVIGICTHLGCVPTKTVDGWLCPCHGSRYDNSGRVLRGPAPKNLYLPPYRFIADDKLLIGEEEKKLA